MRHNRIFSTVVAIALLIGSTTVSQRAHAAGIQGFRLLAPSQTVAGFSRAELLVAGYTAKVLSTKKQIESSDCAARPQFGESASGDALSKIFFNLPAHLGKTMNCTMRAGSVLMIDHIGVICNDSADHQASVECINKRFEDLHNYRVTVDGLDLGAQRFQVVTEKFVIDLENDSAFGLNAGKWRLRAGGWPILLDRLTPGVHTVMTSYKLGKSKQTTTVNLTVTP